MARNSIDSHPWSFWLLLVDDFGVGGQASNRGRANDPMHDPLSVLVMDSDQPSRKLVETVLAGEGFAVCGHHTCVSGVEAFRARPAKVVLIDPALPDHDGYQACERIRSSVGGPEAVIVMLSESMEVADRLRCFHSGADDFLQKPIDLYELVLRVKAMGRRLGSGAKPSVASIQLHVAPYFLDPSSRTVVGPAGTVGLTPAEFQLMAYLMNRPNMLIRTETLLSDVWQYHPGTGSPEIVRFHVRSLRKKIEPCSENPKYLVSAQGHGYMLRTALQEAG